MKFEMIYNVQACHQQALVMHCIVSRQLSMQPTNSGLNEMLDQGF